jgi:hypothetical protein
MHSVGHKNVGKACHLYTLGKCQGIPYSLADELHNRTTKWATTLLSVSPPIHKKKIKITRVFQEYPFILFRTVQEIANIQKLCFLVNFGSKR